MSDKENDEKKVESKRKGKKGKNEPAMTLSGDHVMRKIVSQP